MKYSTLVVLFLVLGISSQFINAQSTPTNITNDYVIISNGDVTNTIPYTDAMDAANWETYRLQNQRYQLAFDNGFTIELKSATELLNLGYPLNLNNYQATLPVGYVPPVLRLLSGNVIGMVIQPSSNTKNN